MHMQHSVEILYCDIYLLPKITNKTQSYVVMATINLKTVVCLKKEIN